MKLFTGPFSIFLSQKLPVSIPLTTILMLYVQLSNATTIVPYVNLGEMALASDAVVVASVTDNYAFQEGQSTKFRTSFVISKSIKGSLNQGEQFELQAWHERIGDVEQVIWGDAKFTTEKTYLLFLSKTETAPYWQTIMLGYGLFEQESYNEEVLFVPTKESKEMEAISRPDGIVPERITVYNASSLVKQLAKFISGENAWEGYKAEADKNVIEFYQNQKAAPSHCTFLNTAGTPYRYTGFPSNDLEWFSEDDGDNEEANVNTLVSNAVTVLGNNYQGISLTYSGTKDFTPDCTDGRAQHGNFLLEVGVREGLVIYNDPCNQITDLTSCSGTLAVGGMWVLDPTSNHTYDGISWRTGYNSFVVVNNGVGTCYSATDYEALLIHELTHGIGIGHIADSHGTANMNLECCNAIQNLDQQCVDYSYAPLLPVELKDFTTQKHTRSVSLHWSTASEKNNDYFLVEKSEDGKSFEAIGQVAGAGNSETLLNYNFSDEQPRAGANYYRLKQVDFNGDFEYSDVRSVMMEVENGYFSVFPNPTYDDLLNIAFSTKDDLILEIELFDVEGKRLLHDNWFLENGINKRQISLKGIAPGVYSLKMKGGGKTYVERVVKM